MTSFRPPTRGAPTLHAILGDNYGNSENGAPSRDSGFVSDPNIDIDTTIDVNVSESSSSESEVSQLRKLVAQQQKKINRLSQQVKGLQGIQSKRKKMDFPSYNQFTSFSQYILVLKIYTGYLVDRGYDNERILYNH